MNYEDQKAYSRGYQAGRKRGREEATPRDIPQPIIPPEPVRAIRPDAPISDMPLDRRLQFVGVTVAAWTGLVKFHAEGLVSCRQHLADAMKMLEEALEEVEQAVADPFASADTHPKGGDVKQAPAPLSGAVGAAETPNPSPESEA